MPARHAHPPRRQISGHPRSTNPFTAPLCAGALALWVAGGARPGSADDAHHAHHDHHEQQVTIDTPLALVGATIASPDEDQVVPCVVIAGGTLSQDRDGRLFRAGVPRRNALERLADALAAGGYASLRYDKVGFGQSKPKPGWTGSYADEARLLAAVVAHLPESGRFGKVIIAGESAGGYLACLAANDGTQADAYLFLGAHCGPGEEIYACNFGRLVEYVEQYPETLTWAAALKSELALGRHYKEMFAAAARGDTLFDVVDGNFRQTHALARRREEIDMPPDRMFAHIRAPALALSGEYDLNVPHDHAARIAQIIREAGNNEASAVSIAHADHSFQDVPGPYAERMRERYTLQSFARPYQPAFYREVILWLQQHVPSPAHAHLDELAAIAENTAAPTALPVRAEAATEIDERTDSTPRRVQLAPGVEIIDDITAADQTAGVETLEGRIGPLLLAEGCQAHFIDMPAGMFVGEHPHSTESIIYTVRGKWVLCSKGRRHVMKPGTLFRFGANVPTGYEVPFDEPAFILIFKGDRTLKNEQEFIDYLKGMAERVKQEQAEGVPYLLKDLPADHPARKFAEEARNAIAE